MGLHTRAWVMAGTLLVALAPAALAQAAVPGEVLDLPVSTRLLLKFHDGAARPWYLTHAPMSTRLLRGFRAEPAFAPGREGRSFGSFVPYEVRPRFSAPYRLAPRWSAALPGPRAETAR